MIEDGTRDERLRRTSQIQLGLKENLAQFSLLVGVNALVGGMIGQERAVLPLLAESEFGLLGMTAALTFILAFGLVKAAANFAAGTLCDRYGRKPVLLAGWIVALPVPLLLIWAPTWSWVIFANALLGVTIGLGADLFNVGMWGVLLIGGGLALLGRVLTGLGVGGTLLAPASAVVSVLSALVRWMSAGLVDDA